MERCDRSDLLLGLRRIRHQCGDLQSNFDARPAPVFPDTIFDDTSAIDSIRLRTRNVVDMDFVATQLGGDRRRNFFSNVAPDKILFIHSTLYLLLFCVTLPLVRHYFRTLLPYNMFFDGSSQSLYVALMPMVIVLVPLLQWADDRLFHSWAERFSRIALLIAFLFIYRYVLSSAKIFFEHGTAMRNRQLLTEQLSSLEQHNRIMRENQQRMTELRDEIHG